MCLISGGNWNNTSNAGVWALNLNNNRTNSNSNTASLNSLMGHALNTSTHRHYCARIRAERPDIIPHLPHYRSHA